MPRLALLCLFAAACGGSHTPSSPPPPPPPAETKAPPVAQLGAPCGAGDSCMAPTECVKYYGIGGVKTGQLSSCEVRCDKAACPANTHCVTIADGPGRVCRADAN